MRALHLFVATALLSSASFAVEFVTNGDFEAGNTGFTSDYTYVAPGANQLQPQGVYTVDDDPNDSHGAFTSMGDHTSGTGLMMIVNGKDGNSKVWEQSVSGLLTGGVYTFSAWASSVHPTSPATLELRVDGSAVATMTLTSTTPDWIQGTGSWTATAGSAVLTIVDLNGAYSGNDLAVDDIGFSGPVPEPATLAVLGIGAAALLRRRRK